MSIANDFVPFDTALKISMKGQASVIDYKTVEVTPMHNIASLVFLLSIIGGWFPGILLANEYKNGMLALFVWGTAIAASGIWMRLAANGTEKGSYSGRPIVLEADHLVDAFGKKYAKEGIRSVMVQEPDGSFTYTNAMSYGMNKAIADARMERNNCVTIQYGDKTVKIVKPVLRYSVAEDLGQKIADWRAR